MAAFQPPVSGIRWAQNRDRMGHGDKTLTPCSVPACGQPQPQSSVFGPEPVSSSVIQAQPFRGLPRRLILSQTMASTESRHGAQIQQQSGSRIRVSWLGVAAGGPPGGLIAPKMVITAKLTLAKAANPYRAGIRLRRLRAWIANGTIPTRGTPAARAQSHRAREPSANRRRQAASRASWRVLMLPFPAWAPHGAWPALPIPAANPPHGGLVPPACGRSDPPLRRRWPQRRRPCRPSRIRRSPHRSF